MSPERFFILGCQRSGTTLMRLILESHPDVFCYDEIKAYAVLQGTAADPQPSARLLGFKIPRWTEQLTEPVLLDEGPEGPCDRFYRGEKIVFLHREVRDTISSMWKLRAGEVSWCEVWVDRIVGAKLARDASFRARYAGEMRLVESADDRLMGLAALYWKYKTEAFFTYRALGFPVLGISYESLVKDPRPVLEEVCSHLGIPFDERLLHHHESAHTELFADGNTVGNTNPRKPIQCDSVAQWKRFLSAKDLRLIERVTGDLPARVQALFSRSTP